MYLAEKDAVGPDGKTGDFASYADALWWGVVCIILQKKNVIAVLLEYWFSFIIILY